MEFMKRHSAEQGSGSVKRILISSLICGAAIPLFSLIFSIFCYSSDDPLGKINLFSLISLLLSGAVAGFISARINRKYGSGSCLIPGIIVALVIFGVSLILSGGAFLPCLMNSGCYALVYLFFAIISKGRDKDSKKRHFRK